MLLCVVLLRKIEGQGLTALVVGVGGVVWTFFCLSRLSFLSSSSRSLGDGPI